MHHAARPPRARSRARIERCWSGPANTKPPHSDRRGVGVRGRAGGLERRVEREGQGALAARPTFHASPRPCRPSARG